MILAIGKKEAAERAVSIRRMGSNNQTFLSADEALAELVAEATAPELKRVEA